MFLPAMFFLRMLGQYVGPLVWVVVGGAMAWFLVAIRRAPPDLESPDGPQTEAG
jgi:hypothetical protein